jgi:hypothetical protein
MKTAADAVFIGKDRQFSRRFFTDLRALSGGTNRLHAGIRLGEGPG